MMTNKLLSVKHQLGTYSRKEVLISLEKLPPHPQFPLYTYKPFVHLIRNLFTFIGHFRPYNSYAYPWTVKRDSSNSGRPAYLLIRNPIRAGRFSNNGLNSMPAWAKALRMLSSVAGQPFIGIIS
jgi:hypothetical protein